LVEKKQIRETKKKSNGEEELESLKATYSMPRRRQWLEENKEEAQRRRGKTKRQKIKEI